MLVYIICFHTLFKIAFSCNPLQEMATHSSILAWRIPWTEELGGLQSTGRKESDMTERLRFHFPGDGDGQGGLVCCDSWGRKE